jgi:hypothetical protein
MLPGIPWTHVSADVMLEIQTGGGYSNILVVLDRFPKIASFIPINKLDSYTGYGLVNNKGKYHGFVQNAVFDREEMFTGQ